MTTRRQFINHTSNALLGLATFSTISLLNKKLIADPSQDNTIATLEKRIPVLMSQKLVPGVAITIINNGQLYWTRSFGVKNYKTKQPIDNNTIFAAASLTKPLFAYTVLKLCEQGQLHLNSPLTEYTSTPYIKDSRIKQINTRMVLSHTTGFPNWSGNAPVWIERTPGTKFGYSGEGYLYLQKVVEQITGQPLDIYIKNNFLQPWGMKNSSLTWESEFETLATYGHDRAGNPKMMSKPTKAISAGSLRTTATDYAQFLMAMMNPGTLESPYLTQPSIEEMLYPQIKITQSLDWGLGWGIEHTPNGNCFWHWGDVGTFKSFTVASPSLKTGIVILTNSENGLKISEEIVRLAIGGQHPAFRFSMIRY
ncbi:beta-lactamase [Gloeothece citriformis PCC 7424]|uniref:Beta-lactamase n=1 Tax=Gloeothece citriformis (strain PCC 7424) TaxID=65393 RepID=B7KBW3_GLOC7|nr:serine hydrolase domain-containing protein [Gloeothece citriformis]ACK68786.1 beta-lactamase [Gloeothece citriformis PCC 7424]